MGRLLMRALPVLIAAALVYFPLSGWKLLYGSGLEISEEEHLSYGESHPVPAFGWGVVLNARGVGTPENHLRFFERCLIRYRGQVREVTSHVSWYAWLSGDQLLRYTNPDGSRPHGVHCPDGTLFLLGKGEVQEFAGRHTARQAYEGELAAQVLDAAQGAAVGAPDVVAEFVRWVEVVNPDGVDNFGYHVPFLDTCQIEQGGLLQGLQDTAWGRLYRYSPDVSLGYRGMGIPCPDGALILRSGSAHRNF